MSGRRTEADLGLAYSAQVALSRCHPEEGRDGPGHRKKGKGNEMRGKIGALVDPQSGSLATEYMLRNTCTGLDIEDDI